MGAGYWPKGCIHGNFLIVSTDFQFCGGCIGTHCCLRSFAPDLTAGTTILDGIKRAVDPGTDVVYSENPDAGFIQQNKARFDYAIVVVSEPPYAEQFGDNLNLTIPEPGPAIIQNVCGSGIRCVVVLVSGRPLVVEPYIDAIDALVAAWLPGTEGQGVADVLFGDYGFTGSCRGRGSGRWSSCP